MDENGTLGLLCNLWEKCPNYIVKLIGIINLKKRGIELRMLELDVYEIKGCS